MRKCAEVHSNRVRRPATQPERRASHVRVLFARPRLNSLVGNMAATSAAQIQPPPSAVVPGAGICARGLCGAKKIPPVAYLRRYLMVPESVGIKRVPSRSVLTQGETLDEVTRHLQEAVAVDLESEHLAELGLTENSTLLVTMEVEPATAQTAAALRI